MMRKPLHGLLAALRSLRPDETGGVGVFIGLSLPVVIGSVGLAFDINRGLEQRIINQRAADMAALGAAMAFRSDQNVSVLQPTAIDLGRVNGVSDATVEAEVVDDYPNDGDQSVRVTVTSQVPFTLARVLGFGGSYSVASQSFASLVTKAQYAAPCFLALSSDSDAFTTNGGASVNAPDCSIAAIGSVQHKSTAIIAHDLIAGTGDIVMTYGSLDVETARFAGSFDVPQWNTAIPDAEHRINKATNLIDPWADDANLAGAFAQLGSYKTVPTLSDPNTSSCSGSENWSLEWNPKNSNPAKNYWTGSGYAIPAGTWCIKKLSTDGGLSVTFADGSDIYIDQGFANGGGTTVNFGDSDVYVNGGFDSGSSGVTFGDGVLWIGKANGANGIKWQGTNRKGDGDVIINGTLALGGGQNLFMGDGNHFFGGFDLAGGGSAIMGDGDFVAVDGVKLAGGSELAVGNGDFIIGTGNGGNAIKLSGSAKFLMGDGQFSANGDIDTAGGSRIAFGTTANHTINGDMKIAGSALFAPGRYTVNGAFWNGTGGTTWPYTSSLTGKTYGQSLGGTSVSGYDMAGVGVTFVLEGAFDLAGGAKTKLWASETTSGGGAIAEMLVASQTTDNVDWTGGSANDFDGTVYFPKAQVKMAGGNATSGTGDCFTLIANRIWLTGGATAGTACQAMSVDGGSGGSTTIRLVH